MGGRRGGRRGDGVARLVEDFTQIGKLSEMGKVSALQASHWTSNGRCSYW